MKTVIPHRHKEIVVLSWYLQYKTKYDQFFN